MIDTIKTLVAVILMLFSIFLLFFGFGYIKTGFNFFNAKVSISEEDIRLMNDLLSLAPSKLDSIENNLKNVMELTKLGGEINISYEKAKINDGEKVNVNDSISGAENIDKIGRYRELSIASRGDIFIQMYNLKLIHERCKNFLLIKSIQGNTEQGIFKVRVYGRK